jgi:copper resistance protein B
MKTLVFLLCAALSVVAYGAEDHSLHQHAVKETGPLLPASTDAATGESVSDHVAPAPPTLSMDGMTDAQMNQLMEMNDNPLIAMVLVDRAEWTRMHGEDTQSWDVMARYGNDFDKIELKSEGEHSGASTDSSNELLWDRVVSRWWSMQAGVRHDTHEGPSRTWGAVGVHGLASYWFDVDASIYVGEEGRTALRITSEYELLLTQRWVMQPRIEVNAYTKQDPENEIGSGVSDAELGVRWRYEIRREFAPYVGLSWVRVFGRTATFAEEAGRDRSELQWLAGIRGWF